MSPDIKHRIVGLDPGIVHHLEGDGSPDTAPMSDEAIQLAYEYGQHLAQLGVPEHVKPVFVP